MLEWMRDNKMLNISGSGFVSAREFGRLGDMTVKAPQLQCCAPFF